jgi:hypothetical protein
MVVGAHFVKGKQYFLYCWQKDLYWEEFDMIKSWPNKEQSLERIKEYCKRRRPISVGGLSAPTLVAGQMAPDHNYTEAYVGVERPWLKEGSPIEAVKFFFFVYMLLFLKVKKKKDLERDDINDVEQNELEVDEVVEQELAFQALSGPKMLFGFLLTREWHLSHS